MANQTGVSAARIADVVAAAQMACLLEASAPKPGNVSPGRAFADVCYQDFVASAVAIAEPLRGAGQRPLGATIALAVAATRAWTSANTNLGIVLLLAPLVKAACTAARPGEVAVASGDVHPLRAPLEQILAATTVQDARDVYAAIRTAAPGGLGTAPAQDVRDEPTVTLQAAMRMAAHRDAIAREYVTGFDTTFTVGVPALANARADGLTWSDAIVEAFLHIVAATPDTHIARRAGKGAAVEVSRAAQDVLDAGGMRNDPGKRAVAALDETLRDPANLRNPGTSADLTTAAIFVVLADGGWARER